MAGAADEDAAPARKIDRIIEDGLVAMFDIINIEEHMKRIYEAAQHNGAVMIVIGNKAVQSGRRPQALGYLTKEHFDKINDILRQHVKLSEDINLDVFYNFTYREYAIVYLLRSLNIEPSAIKDRGVHGPDVYYMVGKEKRFIEIKGSYVSFESQRDRVVKMGRMDAMWSFGNADAIASDAMMESMSAFAFAVFCRDDAIPALMIYVRKNRNGESRHYNAVLKMILNRIQKRRLELEQKKLEREKANKTPNDKPRSDARVYIDDVVGALHNEPPPYHDSVYIIFNKRRITRVEDFLDDAQDKINDAIAFGRGRKTLELHLPSEPLAESIIYSYKDIIKQKTNSGKRNTKIDTRSGAPHHASYFIKNKTVVCIYRAPSTYVVFDHNVTEETIAKFNWRLTPVDEVMRDMFEKANIFVYERFDYNESNKLWWY